MENATPINFELTMAMFANKKFVNEGLITKITKILCHENLELYGICMYHHYVYHKTLTMEVLVDSTEYLGIKLNIVVSLFGFYSSPQSYNSKEYISPSLTMKLVIKSLIPSYCMSIAWYIVQRWKIFT